ncbi:MAG TPA: hypothetical protein VMM14_02700 [Acidimicrobiia bacterium]|nr:hypothetical protein [Acidimicrobiia bacterium]
MNVRLAIVAAIALTVVACTGVSTSTTAQESTTSSTSPTTTEAPSTSTTDAASSTTVLSTTTTSPGGDDGADGSGCSPGPGALPDGEWFGFVVATDDAELEFDLACWFTGDAAVEAAAEDGEESPPPNDYYVRNVNETLRTVSVAPDTEVTWYPEVGDPASETTLSYPEWDSQREQRGLDLGVWLEVDDGTIVEIREQWVP